MDDHQRWRGMGPLALVMLLVGAAQAWAQPTTSSGWPQYFLKPPFWRRQYTACGISRNTSGPRPNMCSNTVDFCAPDPYQPTFEVCTPCWKACLECTRYDTPPRNDSGIAIPQCSSCGCARSSTSGCTSSRTCRAGSYCDKYAGRCISCYECLSDADVREGSCRAVCGHVPRPLMPQLFGLPYDPNNPGLSDWTVDYTYEAAAWFRSSLGRNPAIGWLDLGQLLASVGMDFMPPEQLRYAVRQLTRANATYDGYVPKQLYPPPPPASPDEDPSPPPPRTRVVTPTRGPIIPVFGTSPSPDAASSSPPPPSNTTAPDTNTSSTGRRLAQLFDPTDQVNPSTAPIYPEDLVRVIVMRQLDPYDVFCPSDAVIFSTGVSFPGCTCMSIPSEYQEDTTLITGSTKQWVDYLTLVANNAGANTSNARAECPQGFRCSAVNFQYMRHLFTRHQVQETMGMCVPCLVGEYCPAGTVEKSQTLLEVCYKRSALLESNSNSSGEGRSPADCGNTRLCPAGSYCPLPSQRENCTLGNFCTEGSTEPVTCSFDTIISDLPFATVKPQPDYVLSNVASGSPLAGNYCPEGSEDPFNYCPRGFYCPSPGTRIVCPKGYFCPDQSVTPQRCGILLSCNKEGIGKPSVAWWGFVVFVVLMLCLPVLGMCYTVYEARGLRKTAKDYKLLEALAAMGFGAAGRDSDNEDDESDVDVYGREHDKPKRWWKRVKGWFRRCLPFGRDKHVARSSYSINGGMSGSGGAGGRTDADRRHTDEEDLQEQHRADVGRMLPQGYDRIEPGLTIQFTNLSMQLSNGRHILQSVNGDFPHSHMHAIMGPSGSGKSSFISALIGKAGGCEITGKVMVWQSVGGENKQKRFEEVRYLTGVVPQEDVVHDTMTVRENLTYAAALRLPRETPHAAREIAVRGVLNILDMAHVQDGVVGGMGRKGLSGGQRKRLNIGLELVAKPSLLMLDEPTSGLDAAVSYDIIEKLKYLAMVGMNVMVVIHQPRMAIFNLFDSVLLLGVGGQTVFLGPVLLAEPYFHFLGFVAPMGENLADYYLDVVDGAVPRLGDEEFLPNELFRVWAKAGQQWVIDMLTHDEYAQNQMALFGEQQETIEQSLMQEDMMETHDEYDPRMVGPGGSPDGAMGWDAHGPYHQYGNQPYAPGQYPPGQYHAEYYPEQQHPTEEYPVGMSDYRPEPGPLGAGMGGHAGHGAQPREEQGVAEGGAYGQQAGREGADGAAARSPFAARARPSQGGTDEDSGGEGRRGSRGSGGGSLPTSPRGPSPLGRGFNDHIGGTPAQRSRFAPAEPQGSGGMLPHTGSGSPALPNAGSGSPAALPHTGSGSPLLPLAGSGSPALPPRGSGSVASLARGGNSRVASPARHGLAGEDPQGGAAAHVSGPLSHVSGEGHAGGPPSARRGRLYSGVGGGSGHFQGAAAASRDGSHRSLRAAAEGGEADSPGSSAAGEAPPGRRQLDKVESLRAGIGGGLGDVPSSRRFLQKVESLKEAGLDTLPSAASPLAREVLAGNSAGPRAFMAVGKGSLGRRQQQLKTSSNMSIDLGAAAAAGAAAGGGAGSPGEVREMWGRGASERKDSEAGRPSGVEPVAEGQHEGEQPSPVAAASAPLALRQGSRGRPGRGQEPWMRDLAADQEATVPRGGGSRHLSRSPSTNSAHGGAAGPDGPTSPVPAGAAAMARRSVGTVATAPRPAQATRVTFCVAAGPGVQDGRGSGGRAGGPGGEGGAGQVPAKRTTVHGATNMAKGGAPAAQAAAAAPRDRPHSMAEILKMARGMKAQLESRTGATASQRKMLGAGTSRRALMTMQGEAGAQGAAAGVLSSPEVRGGEAVPVEAAGGGGGAQGEAGKDAQAQAKAKAKASAKLQLVDVVKMTREATQAEPGRHEEEENPRRPLLNHLRGSRKERDGQRVSGTGAEATGPSATLPFLCNETPMLEDDEDLLEERIMNYERQREAIASEMHNSHLTKTDMWRPKDIMAICDNFGLLDKDKSNTLDYTDFLRFFASIRKLLDDKQFHEFVETAYLKFNLGEVKEGNTVDRSAFINGVKALLKQAAVEEYTVRVAKQQGQRLLARRIDDVERYPNARGIIEDLGRLKGNSRYGINSRGNYHFSLAFVSNWYEEWKEWLTAKRKKWEDKYEAAEQEERHRKAMQEGEHHHMHMGMHKDPGPEASVMGFHAHHHHHGGGAGALYGADGSTAYSGNGQSMYGHSAYGHAGYDEDVEVGGPGGPGAGAGGAPPPPSRSPLHPAGGHGSFAYGNGGHGSGGEGIPLGLMARGLEMQDHERSGVATGRQRRASGLGLPAGGPRMGSITAKGSVGSVTGRAGMVSLTAKGSMLSLTAKGSAGSMTGRVGAAYGGEVEMGAYGGGPVDVYSPTAAGGGGGVGASPLPPAREAQLARIMTSVNPRSPSPFSAEAMAAAGSGGSGGGAGPGAGAGAHSVASTSPGSSMTAGQANARLKNRKLAPVLTAGGRVSTDLADLDIAHVASGRVSKSRQGSRAGSRCSSRQGSFTAAGAAEVDRAVAAGSGGGSSMAAGDAVQRRAGSYLPGGGPRLPAHLAMLAAAAGSRQGSFTGSAGGAYRPGSALMGFGRTGSITGGGRAGSMTASAGRSVLITPDTTRVASVAGGTRAQGAVVVNAAGYAGGVTSTGRPVSITVPRRPRRRSNYGDGTDTGAETEGGGGGLRNVFDMIRQERNDTSGSQGGRGPGRQRRRSYLAPDASALSYTSAAASPAAAAAAAPGSAVRPGTPETQASPRGGAGLEHSVSSPRGQPQQRGYGGVRGPSNLSPTGSGTVPQSIGPYAPPPSTDTPYAPLAGGPPTAAYGSDGGAFSPPYGSTPAGLRPGPLGAASADPESMNSTYRGPFLPPAHALAAQGIVDHQQVALRFGSPGGAGAGSGLRGGREIGTESDGGPAGGRAGGMWGSPGGPGAAGSSAYPGSRGAPVESVGGTPQHFVDHHDDYGDSRSLYQVQHASPHGTPHTHHPQQYQQQHQQQHQLVEDERVYDEVGCCGQIAYVENVQWKYNGWVLLGFYIKTKTLGIWQWLTLRLLFFVSAVLGRERGGRSLPSLGRQIWVVFQRSCVKFINERRYAILDMSLVIMLGLIMGAIQGHTSKITKIPENGIIVVLAFALTALVTGLRTFGTEQLIYLTREAQAGLSVTSWMLGRIGWDLILQALMPALYLGFYYAMTVFDTPWELYYLVLVFVAWWGYGVGYLFSVMLESNNALLAGLCITLIFGGVINGINPSVASADGNVLLTGLQYMSYTRWAVEAIFIATTTPVSSSLVFLTAGAMATVGYCEMDTRLQPIEGGLDPGNLMDALKPIFERRYNTTLEPSGNSSSSNGNSATVTFLYEVYEDPSIIDRLCRNAFVLDIVWLFVWGVATRLMTFIVLIYKVERRMTTASVFG